MNFLAHLYLSGESTEERLGNLLADFIKGRAIQDLPPAMQRGVSIHRAIDSYTDSHAVFLQSVDRIRPRWRRYSPILIDVFYDHFLAADWQEFSTDPLRGFLDGVYAAYHKHRDRFPELITYPMDRLIASDRMMTYERVEGIGDALDRLSRRFRWSKVSLKEAVEDLDAEYESLRRDFHAFFPELIDYTRNVQESIGDPSPESPGSR